jgi:integrase
MRLSDALDQFFMSRTLRERTVQTYQQHVNRFYRHFSRDVDLETLTLPQMAKYRDDILASCSPVTYNTARRHLIAVANFAIENGDLKKNPFKLVKPAPVKSGPPRRMSIEVMEKILHDIKTGSGSHSPVRGHWAEPSWFWMPVFKVFYYTGLRLRQLAGMRWEDIDFERNTIRMAYHSSKTNTEWEVPLPKQCKRELQVLLAISKRCDPQLKPVDRVFVLARFKEAAYAKNSSQKTTEYQISAFFKRLKKHTGTNISAHRVRHTTASELMNKTNNPKLVQTLLGHRSMLTTMLYVHPNMAEMQQLVSLMK